MVNRRAKLGRSLAVQTARFISSHIVREPAKRPWTLRPLKKTTGRWCPKNVAADRGGGVAANEATSSVEQAVSFQQLVLEPEFEDRLCAHCGKFTHLYEHRDRRLWLMSGATHLVSKIPHGVDKTCPGHVEVVESAAEMGIAPPVWMIGWDVLAWMGHRRFARHWSVPQIRAELKDAHDIAVSPDLIEDYLRRYQAMVAARESAPGQLADVYRDVEDLVLTIDGLQPEKGHETLYVVRELRCKRIWFAVPLLSSAASEVKRLFEKAAEWAMTLNKPVRAWISDKQQAFLTGVAEVFPGVPHRYCANHFFRDVAKPVLELDSEVKVQMRRKVRGLRAVERGILEERARTAEADLPPIVSSLDPTNGETEASGVKALRNPPARHDPPPPPPLPTYRAPRRRPTRGTSSSNTALRFAAS